jgi:hypothetical protein
VQILALLNVAMIQMVLDSVVFMTISLTTIAVHVMPPAMREMTAVQMHRYFAWVSARVNYHSSSKNACACIALEISIFACYSNYNYCVAKLNLIVWLIE